MTRHSHPHFTDRARDEAALRQVVEGIDWDAIRRANLAAGWGDPRIDALRRAIPPACDGCGRDLSPDDDEGLCPSCCVERLYEGDD